MNFADRYISRNIVYPPFVSEAPSEALSMLVVIPVCNEPDLLHCLTSLTGFDQPSGQVEVLLVVNESELATDAVKRQNAQTIREVEGWKKDHPLSYLRFHLVCPEPFPKKHAGAGLARKTGMDEAVRRFAAIGKPDGIIVSLDADTTVSENYLTAIEEAFRTEDAPVGVTLRFQHRTEEVTDSRQREGMELYELYLHYYKLALQFTGYPHAIYTIGSAFAVRVDAYLKQGGMPKRQAGEDFYFLHKLTALGEVRELNQCCVYPSARLSNRVPFGTGPSIQKWVDGDESLKLTYSLEAFCDLRHLFDRVPDFYEQGDASSWQDLSDPVVRFLRAENFESALSEIKKNSSSFTSFEKRFFQYFNAFRILKFLNFTHPADYQFQDLHEAFYALEASQKFW